MNHFVVDTSVTVAWYIEEAFSQSAQKWQSNMSQGRCTLYVPDLHYLEFSNVLRTLVLRKELSEDIAQKIYTLHLQAPLKSFATDCTQILDTALNYGSTTYDAAFIQLSIQFDIPLITAEKRTRSWVKKMGAQILSVN